MKKLERNLIDNILESEVKLGCASTPVCLLYRTKCIWLGVSQVYKRIL